MSIENDRNNWITYRMAKNAGSTEQFLQIVLDKSLVTLLFESSPAEGTIKARLVTRVN